MKLAGRSRTPVVWILAVYTVSYCLLSYTALLGYIEVQSVLPLGYVYSLVSLPSVHMLSSFNLDEKGALVST